jgi:6-phosphogluconolactonase
MNDVQTAHGLVHVFNDDSQLQLALAERFVQLAQECIGERGRFMVALSGGSTPKALFELLSGESYRHHPIWANVHVFWGDERCVPHTSTDSNYKMACDALLSKVDIPTANIHPTVGQDESPERSALLYETSIKAIFAAEGNAVAVFDLVLLGLGPEGHTASLFPGSAALIPGLQLVQAVYVDKLKSKRITFTPGLINQARHVIFMVCGEGKKDILPLVLSGGPAELPAQYIRPDTGTLEWFVDKAAAAQL